MQLTSRRSCCNYLIKTQSHMEILARLDDSSPALGCSTLTMSRDYINRISLVVISYTTSHITHPVIKLVIVLIAMGHVCLPLRFSLRDCSLLYSSWDTTHSPPFIAHDRSPIAHLASPQRTDAHSTRIHHAKIRPMRTREARIEKSPICEIIIDSKKTPQHKKSSDTLRQRDHSH